ncbi:hypothetical protein Tco_0150012 [Tanacetum coccineum]
MEVFIRGLPRTIEGNVTASKPQTLEEAITITQRLMDQVIKHNSVQGTNYHKRKFDDRRTFTTNNNYPNNRNNNNNRNNDHQQQQNRRQEIVRAYAVTLTENNRSSDQELQKQRASYKKQLAASVSNLSCLRRERALQKHVIDSQRIHVDPAEIEAFKDWAYPTTPTEIRQFLGLASYYRRFIEGFSKIAKPLTELTQKNKKYIWGEDQESAF